MVKINVSSARVCLAGHIDRQKVYVAVNADKRRFPDNKQIIIIILLL